MARKREWKGPFRLEDDSWPAEIRKRSGVYRICCFTEQGKRKKIPRCLGEDETGTLMIGESEDLYRRIGGFEGRARGKKYSHSEADEYSEWELSKYFPLEHLYFEYILADSKDEAERLEYELIEEYRKMYFDTPPLNKSQGKWKE